MPAALPTATAVGTLALTALALFTGPSPDDTYPPRAASPYRLPWPAGVERFCIQGNRGVVSHHGPGRFAWDFTMPVGSPVCAARAGTVTRVVEHHDGNGNRAPNNLVAIDHGDGTTAYYLHMRKGGALVEVGQKVARGERIAESGNVGRSMTPHLHFHVRGAAGTIPITFAEVGERGIPRAGRSYRAGG